MHSPSSSPVPLVLVGCGAVSRFFYASAIQALAPEGWVTLRALVDPVAANRAMLTGFFPQASQYERLEDVELTPDDLVIVATPPRFHGPLAIHALEHGASALVEKPMACTVAEAQAMLEAEARCPGFLAVGHVRRFYASTLAIQEIIQAGILGALRRFRITECAGGWQASSDSFFRPEVAGGGIFLDVGIHILDQLDAWLGGPSEVVYADDAMGGLEANAVCWLRYASGAEGTIRLSKERSLETGHEFEFEKGIVRWPVGRPNQLEIQLESCSHAISGDLLTAGRCGCATDPQSFIEQLRHVAAVKAGVEPNLRIPAAQALRALQVIERAYALKSLLPMGWLTEEELRKAEKLTTLGAQADKLTAGENAPGDGEATPQSPRDRDETISAFQHLSVSAFQHVALTGASGFVGTRLIETMHLGDWGFEPVPLVRGPNSLARLARFALPVRTADLMDPVSTQSALTGCDMLVHAALGDPGQIVKMAEVIAPAAGRAGIRRAVVVSTAAVFGLVAPEGSGDGTEPAPPKNEPYAIAKWQAEQIFERAARRFGYELVILRPSLVYGPRSARMERIWNQIQGGAAGVVDGGRGVFNGIYVDNLVEAIRLALIKPTGVAGTFYVGDGEDATWADVYAALGADAAVLPAVVPSPMVRPAFSERAHSWATGPWMQPLLPMFSGKLKSATKRLLAAIPETRPGNAWVPLRTHLAVEVGFELARLQTNHWRFSSARATENLGFRPLVSFQEGMVRTRSWLEFPNLHPQVGG